MHTETLSAKTCASISNQVFTVFVAELFPTDIRNSALGTGNTFGRLGALCGSLLVNSPVLAHWDLAVLGLTFLGRILYLAFYADVGKPLIPSHVQGGPSGQGQPCVGIATRVALWRTF